MEAIGKKKTKVGVEHCETNVSPSEIAHMLLLMVSIMGIIALVTYGGFYYLVG